MCFCDPCDERTVDFTAFKDAQFDLDVNQIDFLFDSFLEQHQIPGGAVGIIRNNEIVVLRGRGFASVSPNRQFSVGTPGLVGSVSKTLTALGMLVLAEWNLVNFSRSINEYVPVPSPEYDNITIPQLLSHTSGIYNHWPVFGGWLYPKNEEDLKATCSLDLDPPFQHLCADPDHPGIYPRSAYYTYFGNNTFREAASDGKYSNVNFMLLGTIIDMVARNEAQFGKASGYENFVWHHVCQKAEMLSPCLMTDWRKIKNLARGYQLDSSQGTQALRDVPYPNNLWGWEGPPGGWAMTIGDLCRLMIGINRNRIISQTTRDSFFLAPKSQDLSNLELVAPYGSGVFLFDDDENGKGYLHHGDIDGFTARFTYYCSHNVGVALIFNREGVRKTDIGTLGAQLRDRFATIDLVAIAAQSPNSYSQSAVKRLFKEYDRDLMRLIKQVNDEAVEVDSGNRAVARFLIGTEGARGKQLLRNFYNRDYEKAAEIALQILETRKPRSIDKPEDWI